MHARTDHSRDLAVVVAAADGFSGDQVRREESDEEEKTSTETTHWAVSSYASSFVFVQSTVHRTNSDCVRIYNGASSIDGPYLLYVYTCTACRTSLLAP